MCRHLRFLILLAALAAALLVGCGSSDDSEPLTKKAFVKQANAICAEGVKEKDQTLQAGFERISRGGGEPARKDLEEVVLEVVPPLKDTIEQLRDLTPPSEDEELFNIFLEEYEQALQKAEDDPKTALSAGFLVGPNTAAQKYGLTSCSL